MRRRAMRAMHESVSPRLYGIICVFVMGLGFGSMSAVAFGDENAGIVPQEMIVKFKKELCTVVYDEIVARKHPLHETSLSDSFKALNEECGVQSIRPVFPGFNQERQKRRARRAQRDSVEETLPPLDQYFVVRFAEGFSVASVIRAYRQHVDVEWVGPNYLYTIQATPLPLIPSIPNDSHVQDPQNPDYWREGSWGQNFPDLWGLQKTQVLEAQSLFDTNGNGVLDPDEEGPGQGVVVAVIDSGIDFQHPELVSQIWNNVNETVGDANGDGFPGMGAVDDDGDGLIDEDSLGNSRFLADGVSLNPDWTNDISWDDDENGYVDDIQGWNFVSDDGNPQDDHGHGTHVSGTIAALGHNGGGIIGVAPFAKIMPLKGLSQTGGGREDHLAQAIYYAVNNGAHVCNNSWGGPGESQMLQDAFEYAYRLGMISVAAAGNSHVDVLAEIPAKYPSVIAVSAIDVFDHEADFSNFGIKVEVAAPGVDILSAFPLGLEHRNPSKTVGNMEAWNGTSMASPHVAGAMALLKQRYPEESIDALRSRLSIGTDLIDHRNDISKRGLMGNGRLNVLQALQVERRPYFLFQNHAFHGEIHPGSSFRVTVELKNLFEKIQNVELRVRSSDERLEVISDRAAFNTIDAGEVFANSDNDIIIRVADSVEFGEVFLLYVSMWVEGVHVQERSIPVYLSLFQEVQDELGLTFPVNWWGDDTHAHFVDLNQDGYVDILLGAHIYLFDTDSATYQRFEGFYSPANWQIQPGDIDQDGDWDLMAIPIEGSYGLRLYENQGPNPLHFEDITQDSGLRTANRQFQKFQDMDAMFVDVDRDGYVDIVSSSHVYLNQGDGKFEESTEVSGMTRHWSLEGRLVKAIDYDQDFDMDIVFVDIKRNFPLRLYDNQGNGTFVLNGSIDMEGSFGVAIADFDNDSYPDIFMGDGERDDVISNQIFRNTGQKNFELFGRIGEGYYAFWASQFFDLDLDGYADLCIAPGSIGSGSKTGNGFFHNQAGENFENWTLFANAPGAMLPLNTFADVDQDGDMDMLTIPLMFGTGIKVYRNHADRFFGHHWIQIDLRGIASNSMGMGARVQVHAGGMTQTRTVVANENTAEMPMVFGLGNAPQVDRIDVFWPSGLAQTIVDVMADQRITIEEPVRFAWKPLRQNVLDATILNQIDIRTEHKDGRPVTITALDLPPGSRFESQEPGQGLFLWTPNEEDIGPVQIVVQASDGAQTLTRRIDLRVQALNLPPQFTPSFLDFLEKNQYVLYAGYNEWRSFYDIVFDPEGDPMDLWIVNGGYIIHEQAVEDRKTYHLSIQPKGAGALEDVMGRYQDVEIFLSDAEKTYETSVRFDIYVETRPTEIPEGNTEFPDNIAPIFRGVPRWFSLTEGDALQLPFQVFDQEGDDIRVRLAHVERNGYATNIDTIDVRTLSQEAGQVLGEILWPVTPIESENDVTYTMYIEADDGDLTRQHVLEIHLDDLPFPEMTIIPQQQIFSGETLALSVSASIVDGTAVALFLDTDAMDPRLRDVIQFDTHYDPATAFTEGVLTWTTQDADVGEYEIVFIAESSRGVRSEMRVHVVVAPPLQYNGYRIIDDWTQGSLRGNGDGRMNPGERVAVKIDLQNKGEVDLRHMTLRVEGMVPQIDGIQVLEHSASYEEVPQKQSVLSDDVLLIDIGENVEPAVFSLVCRLSDPQGRTWSMAPTFVVQAPQERIQSIGADVTTSGNAQFYADVGGRIHRAYSMQEGSTRAIFVQSSVDSGLTWEEPIELMATSSRILTDISMIGSETGTIRIYWISRWNRLSQSEIHQAVSHDYGQTWTQATPTIPRADTDQRKISSFHIMVDNNHSFYAVWIENIVLEDHVYVSHSQDGGQTWSDRPYLLEQAGRIGELDLCANDLGQVFVAQARYHVGSGLLSVECHYSHNNGQTWTRVPGPLNPGLAWERFVKPSSLSIVCNENGNVYCAWVEAENPGGSADSHVMLNMSHDGGVTWLEEPQTLNPHEKPVIGLPVISMAALKEYVFVGWRDGLSYSHNNGHEGSWESLPRSLEGLVNQIDDIAVDPSGRVYIVSPMRLFYSLNFGMDWAGHFYHDALDYHSSLRLQIVPHGDVYWLRMIEKPGMPIQMYHGHFDGVGLFASASWEYAYAGDSAVFFVSARDSRNTPVDLFIHPIAENIDVSLKMDIHREQSSSLSSLSGAFPWQTQIEDSGRRTWYLVANNDLGAMYYQEMHLDIYPVPYNIYLSSTEWSESFLTALQEDQSRNQYGVYLPWDKNANVLTLPWSNINQIRVKFAEPHDVITSDMVFLNGVASGLFTTKTQSYDPQEQMAEWTFLDTIPTDRLRMFFNDRGAVAAFEFNVLIGDANRSGRTNIADAFPLRASLFQRSGSPGYNIFADFNGSGSVNIYDALILRRALFSELPPEPVNWAIFLDGTTEHVDIDPSTPRLENLTDEGNSFSYTFWFRPAGLPNPNREGEDGYLFSRQGPTIEGFHDGVFYQQGTGRLGVIQWYNEGGQSHILSTKALTDFDRWYHIVVTMDGRSRHMKLYVDGLLAGSLTLSSNKTRQEHHATPYRIGGHQGWYHAHGTFDDVAIYDVVLDEGEIQKLRWEQKPIAVDPRLVLYYPFDRIDDEGIFVYDESMSRQNGRMYGGAVVVH